VWVATPFPPNSPSKPPLRPLKTKDLKRKGQRWKKKGNGHTRNRKIGIKEKQEGGKRGKKIHTHTKEREKK